MSALAALAAALVLGWTSLLDIVVGPPPFVRVVLGTAALLVGIVLLLRAADRIGSSRQAAELVRSVRLAFLAVAAFAASAGWFLGSPLPIVVALVIAGVDVLETTFLLVVMAARGEPRPDEE